MSEAYGGKVVAISMSHVLLCYVVNLTLLQGEDYTKSMVTLQQIFFWKISLRKRFFLDLAMGLPKLICCQCLSLREE